MAELKRHMDVPKERVLDRPTHTSANSQGRINELRGTPDSEDNHHNSH